MKNFANTRIILLPIRRPWYRMNWLVPTVLLLSVATATFIIVCAAKAVR